MLFTSVCLKASTNAVLSALSEEVALNIGPGEKLVGIEILHARSVLGSDKMPAVVLEGLKSASAPLVVRDKPTKKYGA